MIANAVPGFRVGHWTHPSGTTGCTVVLAERPALAFREVRGGAPGTRETDVLVPGNLVRRLDAVLLTGGSAFGLTAADGVVRWLRERQRGFPTAVVPVPIVAAAVVYDLTGTEPIFPDSDAGYAACDAASPDGWLSGRIGAGAGATAGKLRGRQWATPTGIGAATVALDDYRLGALAVVNPVGEVID
ncbi:MAG: P1 family peptidase, partial [Thermomicrobium sp.]|nr:P1 family peptidase [Thermomicrobium sp.]